MQRLSVKGMALSIGLLWGVGNLIIGFAAMSGWAVSYVEVVGSAYLGFEPSVVGAFIGFGWAFVDGFIGGAIFAWLYNKFSGAKASS